MYLPALSRRYDRNSVLDAALLSCRMAMFWLAIMLIALTICAATDSVAETAMQQIEKLKGCEVHSSVILSQVDVSTFRKLGVNLTCEPVYQKKTLYHPSSK